LPTRGIAEFIVVREHGTQARSVEAAPGPEEYDAVVIGNTG
jgi:hypothetical protein